MAVEAFSRRKTASISPETVFEKIEKPSGKMCLLLGRCEIKVLKGVLLGVQAPKDSSRNRLNCVVNEIKLPPGEQRRGQRCEQRCVNE